MARRRVRIKPRRRVRRVRLVRNRQVVLVDPATLGNYIVTEDEKYIILESGEKLEIEEG